MGEFLLSIIKTVLAIVLLPLVLAVAHSFWGHLPAYGSEYTDFFSYGAISFLVVFLFVYRFWGPYELGQKISLGIFRFFSPIDRLLAFFLPFWLILFFIAFVSVRRFLDIQSYDPYFLFFLGFILSMQVIQGAQELQDQETQNFKFGYLLIIFLAFILNVVLIVLGMDLVFERFTFPQFFDVVVAKAQEFYTFTLKKVLFLP